MLPLRKTPISLNNFYILKPCDLSFFPIMSHVIKNYKKRHKNLLITIIHSIIKIILI